MISRALIFLLLVAGRAGADCNETVLAAIRTMPEGGGYATDLAAHRVLAGSVRPGDPVRVQPDGVHPSYCSGATYLVFLRTLEALQTSGRLALDRKTWSALVPRLRDDGQDTLPDGQGVWGRWNANGPGTARLFHELGLGRSFTSFTAAKPGDFMKIFWTDAVGQKENGHSVIYLGETTLDGVESVRFWSSNRPGGMGEKVVPKANIAHAIFSRLENPAKITNWTALPERDPYLAALLKTESSFPEACREAGIHLENTPQESND